MMLKPNEIKNRLRDAQCSTILEICYELRKLDGMNFRVKPKPDCEGVFEIYDENKNLLFNFKGTKIICPK
jgi:hypothetical protein